MVFMGFVKTRNSLGDAAGKAYYNLPTLYNLHHDLQYTNTYTRYYIKLLSHSCFYDRTTDILEQLNWFWLL